MQMYGHFPNVWDVRFLFYHFPLCFPFRMYGGACATYESASLRMFRLGRTDTIRSSSVDSLKFAKAMDDSSKQVGNRDAAASPLEAFSSQSCAFCLFVFYMCDR